MLRAFLQVLLVLGILGAGALIVKLLIDSREVLPIEVPKSHAPLVEVVDVLMQDLEMEIPSQGTVSPLVEGPLVPEVTGRVVWVSESLVPGGFFAKNDPLLRIDKRDYEFAVTRAEAEVAMRERLLAEEQAEAELAKKEWNSLGQGEGTSLVLRRFHVAEAEANLEGARAALERAKLDLARTEVCAPFRGRVREESVDAGQFVSRGESLAELYSIDFAEVRLPLTDDEFSFIDLPMTSKGSSSTEVGPRVLLSAKFGSEVYHWNGRLVRTEGVIDPVTRQIHAIARVKDPYGSSREEGQPPLAVGLYVQSKIQGRTLAGVSVLPRAALWRQSRVLVVNDDSTLESRSVKLARSTRDQIVVSEGLKQGERVCITSLAAVVEGMKVRVAQQDSTTSNPTPVSPSAIPQANQE